MWMNRVLGCVVSYVKSFIPQASLRLFVTKTVGCLNTCASFRVVDEENLPWEWTDYFWYIHIVRLTGSEQPFLFIVIISTHLLIFMIHFFFSFSSFLQLCFTSLLTGRHRNLSLSKSCSRLETCTIHPAGEPRDRHSPIFSPLFCSTSCYCCSNCSLALCPTP